MSPRKPTARKTRWWRSVVVAGCKLVVLLGLVSWLPVLSLRYLEPPTTAYMLRDRLTTHAGEKTRNISYQWVDWAAISPQARLAVVAAEDQKFPEHRGFDVDSIRAVIDAQRQPQSAAKRPRGASTISQQLAKNLFLWPGRSWMRKGLEAYLTVLIEASWTKRRILEMYLNVVQFGDNVYGIEAAAQAFFSKPAGELTRSEAALLAAVLPNPLRLRAEAPSAYVRERQAWISRQMHQLGGSAYLSRL